MKLLQEAPAILKRRTDLNGKPSGTVQLQSTSKNGSTLQYPRYCLNDFHYQTDGWLSMESAQQYEMSSETIFIGSQDVMQRQTVLPLTKHFQSSSSPPRNMLEVACGTGRFSTFVRDQFSTADVTLIDLSPYYLDKARDNASTGEVTVASN
jgi:ubiquinone/menaquinone biosynthesis C-methylase UbiE